MTLAYRVTQDRILTGGIDVEGSIWQNWSIEIVQHLFGVATKWNVMAPHQIVHFWSSWNRIVVADMHFDIVTHCKEKGGCWNCNICIRWWQCNDGVVVTGPIVKDRRMLGPVWPTNPLWRISDLVLPTWRCIIVVLFKIIQMHIVCSYHASAYHDTLSITNNLFWPASTIEIYCFNMFGWYKLVSSIYIQIAMEFCPWHHHIKTTVMIRFTIVLLISKPQVGESG